MLFQSENVCNACGNSVVKKCGGIHIHTKKAVCGKKNTTWKQDKSTKTTDATSRVSQAFRTDWVEWMKRAFAFEELVRDRDHSGKHLRAYHPVAEKAVYDSASQ